MKTRGFFQLQNWIIDTYLVSFLVATPNNIIIPVSRNNAPYKNEDNINKKLKSTISLINRQHSGFKGIFISTPFKRLINKKANTILKRHVNKLKEVEVELSHLNKDGLHLNNYHTIRLAENFISSSEDSYRGFKYFRSIPTQDT